MSKKKTEMEKKTYAVSPIGIVKRGPKGNILEIFEHFRPALAQLDSFSHVLVIWWADRHDNEKSRGTLQCRPPYANDTVTGVFACRAEYRPNPIAITVCRIEGVDEGRGTVVIREIDALDGTPILDLKAYFPVCDRVREAHIPKWLRDWPQWMPDEGIGL